MILMLGIRGKWAVWGGCNGEDGICGEEMCLYFVYRFFEATGQRRSVFRSIWVHEAFISKGAHSNSFLF